MQNHPSPYRPLSLGDSVKKWCGSGRNARLSRTVTGLARRVTRIALYLVFPLTLQPVSAQDFETFKGHGGPVMALDVAPDGTLISGSFDNAVGIWPAPRWLDGHNAAVTAVDASQGRIIVSGSDDFRVLLWPPDGPPIELGRHQGKVADIAVSAEGARIATAGWDGFVQLHAALPGSDRMTDILAGHASNVTAVAFAPSGGLFSASSDGTLRVWEGPDNALTSRVIARHGFGINRMVVTDDWIAYGGVDGGTRVIHPETGAQIADLTLDRRPILSMDYHEGSGQLAVGDGHGFIMMVDTENWRITRDFRAMRQGPVWALAFSNDGTIIHAGGLDDVIYAWPVALLSEFDPVAGEARSFLRDVETMPNGERQFMRKCSICHSLEAGPSRKAGPTLHEVFGRRAGTVPDYRYSATLDGSEIVWDESTIDALFDEGPDHYIPGSKMPMQVIAGSQDRADLIAFLKDATASGD